VTTAHALTRYQHEGSSILQGGELVGKRPCDWIGAVPTNNKSADTLPIRPRSRPHETPTVHCPHRWNPADGYQC